MTSPPHLLHVFATFTPGGPQVRTARLIAALGNDYRHSILALDGDTGARTLLPDDAPVEVLPSPPRRGTLGTVRAMRKLLRQRRPDLLLTYNWGAIEAVLAARIPRSTPTLHHEDGFRPDEVAGFKRRRIVLRRLALPGTRGVVVPSEVLHGIALAQWKLAPSHVHLIPNGLELDAFPAFGDNASLRRELGIPASALVVGSVGHLRGEKNPVRLVEALGAMKTPAHLLLLGDGPERAAVEAKRDELGLAARVHMLGHRAETAPCYAAMDVFAIPSDTEQMPVALLEAMASGLSVVSTDVGDVRRMLPAEQAPGVVPLAGEETARGLAAALDRFIADDDLRAQLGRANRARVEERYSFETMLAAYRARYEDARR